MLAVNKVVCVFLLSCFDKELINFENCPKNCKCYSAPKDGYNYDYRESKSLICEDINDLSGEILKTLEPINTLAVGIGQNARTKLYATNFYVNNFYLYGIQTSTQIFFNSISPFIGLNVNSLQVLTLVDLNLNTFNWEALLEYKELKAIHIENCSLTKINEDDFGLLRSLKIISVSIIGSKLKTIGENTFNDWNELKMISIVGNPLDDMYWLKTNLPKLWYLDLRDNYIWQIPSGKFWKEWVPKLRVLKLDRNNLKLLYWLQLSPLLSKLKEFSLEGNNTLCMNENTENLYKDIYKYNDTFPTFFDDSMHTMLCKDVVADSPVALCINHFNVYIKEPSSNAYEHCLNWKGGKT